jgi:hypothetical protein
MAKPTNLDEIRRSALAGVEESKRLWRRVLVAFGVLEGGCFVAYALSVYFGYPIWILILVAAVLVYSTVSAGIMGLKLHLDNSTQRVLKAIESVAAGQEDGPRTPEGSEARPSNN